MRKITVFSYTGTIVNSFQNEMLEVFKNIDMLLLEFFVKKII